MNFLQTETFSPALKIEKTEPESHMKLLVVEEKTESEALQLMIKKYCPSVKTVFQADSIEKAAKLISENNIDGILLDIHLPWTGGYSLSDMLGDKKPEVIFVTEYQEHLVKAFRAGSLDYLLKPVAENDLVASLQRLEERIHTKQGREMNLLGAKIIVESMLRYNASEPKEKEIIIPCPFGYKVVKEKEILLVEGNNNTTFVHLTDRQILKSTHRIRDFEEMLTGNKFYRIHKSYLVNLEQVSEYTSRNGNYVILSNKMKVDVSRKKLSEFHLVFRKYRAVKG